MHCHAELRLSSPGQLKAARRRYKTFMIDEILSKETCDYFEKLSLYSVCPSLVVRPKPLHSCTGKTAQLGARWGAAAFARVSGSLPPPSFHARARGRGLGILYRCKGTGFDRRWALQQRLQPGKGLARWSMVRLEMQSRESRPRCSACTFPLASAAVVFILKVQTLNQVQRPKSWFQEVVLLLTSI